MAKLVLAETIDSIQEIADIANVVWNEYFPSILGQEQVDYMVSKFQCVDAIQTQLQEGYKYYFICQKNINIGYVGLHPRAEKKAIQVSKFYLLKQWRGMGYGREIMEEISGLAINHSFNKLYLTVNKYNYPSINAYLRMGFLKTGKMKADIGDGFFMDDYEMERLVR